MICNTEFKNSLKYRTHYNKPTNATIGTVICGNKLLTPATFFCQQKEFAFALQLFDFVPKALDFAALL